MPLTRKLSIYLLCCIQLLAAASCSLDYELPRCPYNVRFVYHTCDGRSRAAGNFPIESVRQWVYNEQHILVGEFPADSCQQGIGTLQLPPGNYTLVAWANAPEELVHIAPSTPEMRGTIVPHPVAQSSNQARSSSHPAEDNARQMACTAPLYYGTLPFSVPHYGEISYNVGMMHAHARLNLTVEWSGQVPQAVLSARRPLMTLSKISAGYYFDEGTPHGSYRFPQHHPYMARAAYQAKAVKSADYKIRASFLTFRLEDQVPLILNLSEDSQPLIRPIELSRYFSVLGIGLDNNLCQEFNLTVRIGRQGAIIVETNVSGWEEGGNIEVE